MKHRESWADYVKGIGILLVLLGHCALGNTSVLDFIYSFHMPLFFFISGYFISNKDDGFKKYFSKNVRSLLVPYFCFYIITLPFGYYKASTDLKVLGDISTFEVFRELLNGMLLCKSDFGTSYMNNASTWFLVALFEAKIFFYFNRKVCRSTISLCIGSIVGIIITLLFREYGYCPSFRLGCMSMAYPFVCLGYYIRQKDVIRSLKKINVEGKLASAMISLTLCFIISEYNGHVQFSIAYAGKYIVLMYITGILGTLSVVLFSLNLAKIRLLSYIGTGTIVVLGLHTPILAVCRYIFSLLLHYDIKACPLYAGVMMTAFVALIHLPIIYVIRKYTPWMIGKGNRIVN